MKHKTRTMAKRWLAVVLCLCMIFPFAVTLVSAAEEPAYTGGLCEHHTEHTAECGYVEAVEGQLCTHVHDGNCGYQEPTEEVPYAHVHDDSCGYQAATEEIPCDKECIDKDGDGNIDHQEGCAYQPAVEEQPCTHTHDENCEYQAATEGSPCAHVHNEDCGYVEAVEGQPCTFICEICSGNEAEPQDDGEVEYTIDVPLAANGISGVEYNLMTGVSVSPKEDADGNPIQVRVSSVMSSEKDFSWDGKTTITPQSGGVVYTITYAAYVTVGEQETVLANKTTTLTIIAAGNIGGKLLKYAKTQKTVSGEIFLTRNGTGLGRRQIWAEMKRLCKEAGVAPTKVFPHNLRHLFATTFYRVCKDIVRLADVLGHSSIDTTRIYLMTTGAEHTRLLDRLGLVS